MCVGFSKSAEVEIANGSGRALSQTYAANGAWRALGQALSRAKGESQPASLRRRRNAP